ncbi:hypothetical protein AVEN_170744-1 [Araneus ventricosus]|uniref:Uncharacterized protein n=1 Tax=Araneus ventricosus TaxID=182803 RepID=A0A4Y2RRD1_ARAVE|nr:hypothetical protein AVEN_170744-1 [Araneus ventricosus]
MRRSGSLHKKGDFGGLGELRVGLHLRWCAVRLASNRDSEYSHQGLRVLIFTDRPGPRAHLVGVYIELRDFTDFSSAVQVGFAKLINYLDLSYSHFEVIFIDFCTYKHPNLENVYYKCT